MTVLQTIKFLCCWLNAFRSLWWWWWCFVPHMNICKTFIAYMAIAVHNKNLINMCWFPVSWKQFKHFNPNQWSPTILSQSNLTAFSPIVSLKLFKLQLNIVYSSDISVFKVFFSSLEYNSNSLPFWLCTSLSALKDNSNYLPSYKSHFCLFCWNKCLTFLIFIARDSPYTTVIHTHNILPWKETNRNLVINK
jgi:hypothetical protein